MLAYTRAPVARLYLAGLAFLVGAVAFGVGYRIGESHQIGDFRRSTLDGKDVVLDEVGQGLRDALLWPDPIERVVAVGQILRGLGPEELESVQQAYQSVFLDYGDVELALFAEWWASFDPEGAWRWTRQNQEAEAPSVVHAVMRAWSRRDPQAALLALENLRQPGLIRPYRQSLIMGWDESGQPGLVDYIHGLPGLEDRQPALAVLARRRVLALGPEAAFAWAEGLGDRGDTRFKLNLYRRVVTAAAHVDLEATAAFVSRHAGTPYGDGLARRLGIVWVKTDGSAAMEWLSTLPEGPDRRAAIGESFRLWLRLGREQAVAWVSTVPFEPWLAPALSMYARSLAAEDPEEALRLSARIGEEGIRNSTDILILRVWVANDAERARAYMDDAGVSEYVRTKVAEDPRARKKSRRKATEEATDPAEEAPPLESAATLEPAS